LNDLEFIADESCDFIIVRTLRESGYDVLSAAETNPGSSDYQVIQLATDTKRILLTEDKDFGEWVFAHGEQVQGVILIRFPAKALSTLPEEILVLADDHGFELKSRFTVLEPGRARLRSI
jgi:predicted nuclease of predicted toxin-antitoxin system